MLQRALGELVQLDIRTAEDIWCVEIDISQLEASVLNLAVNARDAMPHGGRLVIEVDNSHLDHDYAALFPDASPGEYVMLRVRDNGHGMDAATLARVFEPFFTTKQVGRGTGLGLSMVHGFVKQSGGHVLIDSVEGGGTSITMMFPRSPLALPSEARVPQTGLVEATRHARKPCWWPRTTTMSVRIRSMRCACWGTACWKRTTAPRRCGCWNGRTPRSTCCSQTW